MLSVCSRYVRQSAPALASWPLKIAECDAALPGLGALPHPAIGAFSNAAEWEPRNGRNLPLTPKLATVSREQTPNHRLHRHDGLAYKAWEALMFRATLHVFVLSYLASIFTCKYSSLTIDIL